MIEMNLQIAAGVLAVEYVFGGATWPANDLPTSHVLPTLGGPDTGGPLPPKGQLVLCKGPYGVTVAVGQSDGPPPPQGR
jgi:hypothetical protein